MDNENNTEKTEDVLVTAQEGATVQNPLAEETTEELTLPEGFTAETLKNVIEDNQANFAPAEKKGPSKEDQAAYIFQEGVPKCLALAANMKAGQIARVYSNLLQFPLVESPKKFRCKAENDLFVMSLQVMDAKTTLMAFYKDEIDAAQTQAVMSMSEEIIETKTEGETNEIK